MGLLSMFRRKSALSELSEIVRKQDFDLEKLRNELYALRDRHALLQDKHETMALAFHAFRQRVYAWRKWEPKDGAPPVQQPVTTLQEVPDERPPLDKAAILRAHRSKQ